MKVGAVFPIGTSDGGCPAAIAEILKTETFLEVHLLYGNQGAADSPAPAETVARIKTAVSHPGLTWATPQPVEPFNFAATYEQVRLFVDGIAAHQYSRIYIGITGATNPIVTSLFQTAMAYLPGQVIPVYVQARASVSVQHFIASEIRDRVVAEEALATASSGQIRVGALLAEKLPQEGDWKYLRTALHALALWDDFDYKQSAGTLVQLARKAPNHPLLIPLRDTITRIAIHASQMSGLTKLVKDIENFGHTAARPDWPALVSTVGPLLVEDVLANARRRITEGRYTDSVLRSYRAGECATQICLFILGIHPSRPDACRSAYNGFPQLHPSSYAETGAAPASIAFTAGLKFLDSIGKIEWQKIHEPLKKLGFTRNHTYLEHGYVRVQKEEAESCLDCALSICEHLLKLQRQELIKRCEHFELQFIS